MADTNCRIFIGSELAPTLGGWIDLDDLFDKEDFDKAVAAIRKRNKDLGHEESGIMDHEGFLTLLSGLRSPDAAWVIHEVIGELSDVGGPALVAWAAHRGRDYTLFAAGKLRKAHEIVTEFREDYLGTFKDTETYAEGRFTEEFQSCHKSVLSDRLQAQVFAYMDWESLAEEYENNDVFYGPRNTQGVPVFQRS